MSATQLLALHGKKNLCGSLIRRLRKNAGLSQEQLAAKLQIAGWDVDGVVIAYIENGQRNLLDYELKFILDAFGKNLHDIA